ncbi:uncharacterized protein LOC107611046 [Arachis ipaensis]|uniref:uncharacterized protein LOC107611046 n=1 Tax=Arachis ipaensis TaxID=130454 RepID=UPI0007AF0C37|nr:uncharacterized protein LOC107611046 [Arachis ipaensis]
MDGTALDNPTLYRQLVGGLVYLTVTRPEIAYLVHVVSHFLLAPHTTHYAVILWILIGTIFQGLYFFTQSSSILQAHADADWAGDPTDCHFTIDYYIFLGDSLVSWRAKKQTFIAQSSIEAEYRALIDPSTKVIAICWILEDLGTTQSFSTNLYCDNGSSIHIVHNNIFHEQTKYIENDCHFVQ